MATREQLMPVKVASSDLEFRTPNTYEGFQIRIPRVPVKEVGKIVVYLRMFLCNKL